MGQAVSTKSASKVKNLKPLFEPKSVAVIGASRRKESAGYAVLHNLLDGKYSGKIYPVNPKADELEGIKCYAAIQDIPDSFDLAVLVIPGVAIPQALKECGEKGAKAAIIISAGFREIGAAGVALEKEVLAISEQYNIPILGPNCLGLTNTLSGISMNASFGRGMPSEGNIAFVSQSGALCAAILDYARGENIGFSKFVSLGNKMSVSELDILRYLRDDPSTEVILMYIEDLVEGRGFIELCREITAAQKPILVIKSGRTLQGAKAAVSHTGSLMGADEVYDAIFSQAGVLRIDSVQEMFDLAIAFANEPLPKSNRTAIVTNAGGPGIMATDACVRYGLTMAELTPETQEALRKVLPVTANVTNPVDVIGDAQHDRYESALKIVARDPNVDSMLVILTPQAMTDIEETAQVIAKFDKECKQTVVATFMGGTDVAPGIKILGDANVPQYLFPEAAARALNTMARYQQWLDSPKMDVKKFSVNTGAATAILEKAKGRGQDVLLIHESMQVLQAYGFPLPAYHLARNQNEAVEQARSVGFPVVLKIVSRDAVHKFDVGGICLNLKDEDAVRMAYQGIMKNFTEHGGKGSVDGIFVQAMSPKGREVILGMRRDPHFGPVLMFGLGGIYVEALKDVTFRVAPIRENEIHEMIQSIRTYALLKGVRGEKPADFETLADCIGRLSQLACEQPGITEIDINPLLVYAQKEGAWVLDARMVIETK